MITDAELIVFNCQAVLNDISTHPDQKVEELRWYINHTYFWAQLEWAVFNGFPIDRLNEEERAELQNRLDRRASIV